MSSSVWQEVSNWLFGSFKVRASQLTDASRIQHIRLDVGSGTSEDQITAANPLPVTAAFSGTADVNLIQVGGAAVDLGQEAMASSIPVAIASNQTAIPITDNSGSITVDGSVSVSGTASVNIANYGGTATTLGQKADAASIPITISSDQTHTESTLLGAGIRGQLVGGQDVSSSRFTRAKTIKLGSSITGANTDGIVTFSSLAAFDSPNIVPLTGNTANGLDVDVTRVTGTVTVSTTTPAALTASSPTFATVGTSSASAVASNSSRKGLVLTNTSSNTISFGLGATAVLNSGITLTPRGVWVMDERTFTTAAVNAIASAASSNLAVQEFV